MFGSKSRVGPIVAVVGAVLGFVFAVYSSLDYAAHLDRNLHDVHCSFIPGAPATSEAEACRAAMYSPYSAVFKQSLWGGIPISLFALGAFSFFGGFGLYLAVAADRASKAAVRFFGGLATTPLIVSAVMGTISAVELGSFCKTCVGIYGGSLLLAVGALLHLLTLKATAAPKTGPSGTIPGAPMGAPTAPPEGRPQLPLAHALIWLVSLGIVTMVPAAVYASSVPSHDEYLGKCGTLPKPEDKSDALLKIRWQTSRQQATLFEDPLCPTCKAFHYRLDAEGMLRRLDITMVMFPLDNECNWMLDRPLHPGACTLSKAVICSPQPLEVLEWAYDEQSDLAAAGKAGEQALMALIERRWGKELATCTKSNDAKQRLNKHLRYAVDNAVPVSTPQVYLGNQRMCDEDTDIGLRYAMSKLAPGVTQ